MREDFIRDFVQRGKASGASKEEVSQKLGVALKEFDAKYSQPEPQKGGKGLLHEVFVAPYERTAKNIGAAAVTVPQSILAGSFQKVADNPQATALYQKLGLNPQDIATKIANVQVGDTQKQAQYVADNPLKAGGQQLLDSADILLQAKGLKALKGSGIASKGKTVVKTVASPKKAVVNARNAAATGKKINNAKLIKEAEKVALDNPGAKKEWSNVIKPQLQKMKDAKDVVAKIDRWNKKAFLKGGGMKSSHAADLYGDVLNLLRGELKRVAPKATKYQKILQLGHTVPKTASKLTWKSVQIAGLAKLLGL